MIKIKFLTARQKAEVFKLYSSGARPPEWKEEFEHFERLEERIKRYYSHLPDNKAISMARGAVLNYFNEYSSNYSPDEG